MSSRLAFQTQLASIMEVLANAAVAEICKLVDDDYAVVSLQMSQCQKENKALKRKLHLLELKMARGTAERRLRESAFNSGRLKVQIGGGSSDRLREMPTGDGAFDQQTVSLWPDRALTTSVTEEPQCPQSKSPDVQFVEPEPVIVKEETKSETKEEEVVHLIEDNDIMEPAPCVADGPKLGQIQTCSKTGTQTPSRLPRRKSATNRRVESEEEPDLVLVKVEEPEEARDKPNTPGLIIQEGLVESSTDDFKAELPFADASQISANQVHESNQGLSEVSFGSASLWTNDNLSNFSQDPNLPGPSSHIAAYNTNANIFPNVQVPGAILTGQLPAEFLDPNLDMPASFKKKRDKTERKKNCACDFCGKRFSSPANLESHLRTHTGEKPFACNICGKLFSQIWNMKIHKNIHTGERPYQCSVCNEKFSDPSNLKKHEKRHFAQNSNGHTNTSS
ncbi:zinc finger protein 287 isoform X1 [Periophthalmus magnuspinnatus]|uniref:zinc finger protein 287 isoform X1 n=1 Tax=Periophthalmus magnuspinnatus TaxID=409849 RepID=UPI0024374461|nr:zinc finger protein 287 isoform X1 [Periophthalmus magnuspinnatus]